jgi:hypothetical protein
VVGVIQYFLSGDTEVPFMIVGWHIGVIVITRALFSGGSNDGGGGGSTKAGGARRGNGGGGGAGDPLQVQKRVLSLSVLPALSFGFFFSFAEDKVITWRCGG